MGVWWYKARQGERVRVREGVLARKEFMPFSSTPAGSRLHVLSCFCFLREAWAQEGERDRFSCSQHKYSTAKMFVLCFCLVEEELGCQMYNAVPACLEREREAAV